MATSGVYKLQFQTGEFYLGSSKNIEARHKSHINSMVRNQHDSKTVQETYNKLKIVPTCEVLKECSKEELFRHEQDLLNNHHGGPNCLNIAKCAESPRRGVKGEPKSDEFKAHMSTLMKDRVFSDEHRARISAAKKGVSVKIPMTEETKQKMSIARMGRIITEEQRQKISDTLQGHKPAFSKPVVLINTGQEFDSAMLAERTLGVSGVSRACRNGYNAGQLPNGEKMKWQFKSDV